MFSAKTQRIVFTILIIMVSITMIISLFPPSL